MAPRSLERQSNDLLREAGPLLDSTVKGGVLYLYSENQLVRRDRGRERIMRRSRHTPMEDHPNGRLMWGKPRARLAGCDPALLKGNEELDGYEKQAFEDMLAERSIREAAQYRSISPTTAQKYRRRVVHKINRQQLAGLAGVLAVTFGISIDEVFYILRVTASRPEL